MHIRAGEVIVAKVKRHKTPFVIGLIEMALVIAPVYVFIIFIDQSSSASWINILYLVVSLFVGLILTIYCVDYLLDTIIITSKRVIHIEWRSLFKREQFEVELEEIQDVITIEKGLLSKLKIFDYGLLAIETAASKTSINFKYCPDPESVKHLIFAKLPGKHHAE